MGGIVVNQVRRPLLSPTSQTKARKGKLDSAAIAHDLERSGVTTSAGMFTGTHGSVSTAAIVAALCSEAADHAERIALEQRERDNLDSLERPTYEIPYLVDGVDARSPLRARRDAARAGHGMTPVHQVVPRARALDVDALLDDRGIAVIVCCGSGGVGKTTTAAALALRAAERGRDVVVLTIDPARRLAQSLGLTELDNDPDSRSSTSTARARSPR